MDKEELNKRLKDLSEERNKYIEKLNSLQKEFEEVTEMYYSQNDSYVRVICVGCGGKGYIEENDKKILCRVCSGKNYNWMIKFKEDINDSKKN